MAVTHADVSRSGKSSKSGAFVMVVSILLGLLCFILCLIAEASRSEVKRRDSQCTYTGSGKLPLASATAAFGALAAAMVVQHVFLLVALSKSDEMTWEWDPDAKTLTWQAAFFFVATWTTFAVGEIQLLIGLTVESGHLKNWETPRPSCLAIRQGLFTAAGVLGLATVFFASGLYITALRAERYIQIQENMRRDVLEVSVMYASPPPRIHANAIQPQGPNLPTHDQQNLPTLDYYLRMFDKQSRYVHV